jgi:hypothetical protein
MKNIKYNNMDLFPVLQYTCGAYGHSKGRPLLPKDRTNIGFSIMMLIKSFFMFMKTISTKTQVDQLFISSMNNQTLFNNELVDRVVDPLIEDSQGNKTLKIAFSTHYRKGKSRYPYEFNMTYLIYFLSFFFLLKNLLVKRKKVLKIYEKLDLCTQKIITLKKMSKIVSILESGNFLFKILIKNRNIPEIYVSNPYSLETISAIYVANNLKMSSYAIQHGYQNKFHYAFSFDQRFNTLPMTYLTWDEKSARSVSHFASSLVIGYSWKEFVLKNCDFSEVDRIANGFKKIVLITTQPTTGLFSNEIIELIKREELVFFLYRLHPSQYSETNIKRLKEVFIASANIDFSYSSCCPLPILLAKANYHVTGFSSCVLEAVNQDCKTIVYHPKAILYYGDLIDNGTISYTAISDVQFGE